MSSDRRTPMSDELDLIRHLRAPAPDPSTEVVRRHKEHLMQFIDTSATPHPVCRDGPI